MYYAISFKTILVYETIIIIANIKSERMIYEVMHFLLYINHFNPFQKYTYEYK